MEFPPRPRQTVTWCLWVACGLVVAGGVVALAAAAGGTDRIAGVALPFAVAAAALAANALTQSRRSWLSLLLYVAAALAVCYGMLFVLSLPLRLAVEDICQPAPAPCPLGFDRPITTGENFGVYAVVISGLLALFSTFLAAEFQYRYGQPRLSEPTAAPTPPAPPAPAKEPSEPPAIAKEPAPSTEQTETS